MNDGLKQRHKDFPVMSGHAFLMFSDILLGFGTLSCYFHSAICPKLFLSAESFCRIHELR